MMVNDVVNGLFELSGSIFTWICAYKLVKDKQVKGVYIPAWGFFAVWGIWNLYYYPSLNQWMSFIGGLSIVMANSIWVVLAIIYSRRKT